MEKHYKIGNSTQYGMLAIALVFDAIQFLTPGYTDTVITAAAALFFGMIFYERGALTIRGTGILRLARIILPISELVITNLPAIFLTVWVQIKISRMLDASLPDEVHMLQQLRTAKSRKSALAKDREFIRTRSRKMARAALRNMYNTRYGKGRRGEETQSRLNSKKVARHLDAKK
jgi:hypothetical protein